MNTKSRLQHICQAEGIHYDDNVGRRIPSSDGILCSANEPVADAPRPRSTTPLRQSLDALIKVSDGDLRRAITFLQSASRLHSTPEDPITPYSVQEIGGVVPDETLHELVSALGIDIVANDGGMQVEDVARPGKLATSSNLQQQKNGFAVVRAQVEKITRDGYSATQILTQVSWNVVQKASPPRLLEWWDRI